MDVSTVSSVVSTLGFPIGISLAFIVGYVLNKFMDRNAQIVHEMVAITTALNNNTVVLQKICDKLDADSEKEV